MPPEPVTLKLRLAEQAWAKIDKKVTQAIGSLEDVVRQIQETLDGDDVASLCDSLGICSAGFMFLDTFRHLTRFFSLEPEPSSSPPTYKTRYISQSELSKTNCEELNLLFLRIRDRQKGWLKAAYDFGRSASVPPDQRVPPEYVRCLPYGEYPLVTQETELRRQFGIHYCSYGEMVVTAFLWRALSAAQKDWGNSDFDTVLPLNLDFPASADLRWSGENLWETVRRFDGRARLEPLWQDLSPGPKWRDQWKALQLDPETNPEYWQTARQAGIVFCKAINPDGTMSLAIDDDSINREFSAALKPLLNALNEQSHAKTVNDALTSLELYARFPVPPFYVWNAIERDPKVYCVFPVWSSQGYPLRDNGKVYHHLGLALTALRPVAEIDWTWPGHSIAVNHPVQNATPRILATLLRLMALPLVEHNLYVPLVREAEASMTDRLTAYLKAEINELTGHPEKSVIDERRLREIVREHLKCALRV